MKAVLTDDGKIALPPRLRKDAQLQLGDRLEVQLYKGSIVLRKHQPLTPEQCAALPERSRSQPSPPATADPDDEMFVECAAEAQAAFVVTGDKGHLLVVNEAAGIPIVAVSEFLRLISVPDTST